MDKYRVQVTPRAAHDVEEIFRYIVEEFQVIETASNLLELLEIAIVSLDEMPYRGAERKIGMYANRGYRQLFVKNYTIIYRIDEQQKKVFIVAVRYTPSNF